MKIRLGRSRFLGVIAVLFFAGPQISALRAGGITIPPEVRRAMDLIYQGDPDAAVPIARSLEEARPDHPLGYLLEGEALWWKRYCAACSIRYGMFEAWQRGKEPGDDVYLTNAAKEI